MEARELVVELLDLQLSCRLALVGFVKLLVDVGNFCVTFAQLGLLCLKSEKRQDGALDDEEWALN